MFERFTDEARRVVVVAQEEARLLNHNYIGTEHILLGLIRAADGIPARVLDSFGVTLSAARGAVEEIVGAGATAPSGHIPFTPRAKKVLELSLREALRLDHQYIGSEHILLGLLREGEGVGARVLVTLGASLSEVGDRVLALLEGPDDPKIAIAHGLESQNPRAAFGLGPRPLPRCSLCGRNQEKVGHLLVSGGMVLCDQCARDAVAQLDALPDDAPKRVRFHRRDVGVTDKDVATRAIESAFDAVIGPQHVPPGDALWAVEGGAEMEALLRQLDEASGQVPVTVNDVTVERVRFLDDDEAEVSLGIWMAGSVQPMIQPAHAVLVDGTWKVSRATVEHLAALAQAYRRPPL